MGDPKGGDEPEVTINGARLFAKFVLVIMPCFLGASMLGLFWLSEGDLRRYGDTLSTRIGNAAARVSIGIERHAAERGMLDLRQDALPNRLLAMLLADTAVVCAEYRDDTTSEIRLKAPFGLGCSGQSFDSSLELPTFAEGEGSLIVNFSTAEIEAARRSRREFSFLALCLGLLITAASSWLAFRVIIGEPLSRLLLAIRQSRDGGASMPIVSRRRDELGVVMRAFDGLQENLEREASAARDAYQRLDHLYNATPALLFSCDEDGRLTSVSDHWSATLGYRRDEVIGQADRSAPCAQTDPRRSPGRGSNPPSPDRGFPRPPGRAGGSRR